MWYTRLFRCPPPLLLSVTPRVQFLGCTMAKNEWGMAAGRWAPPPARAVPLPFAMEQPWISRHVNDAIHSEMCNMWLNGDQQLRDHLIGHKHRRRTRAARALRIGQAMHTITMLLVFKWQEEQKALCRRALLMVLKMWAGPRWIRAVLRSHMPQECSSDGKSFPRE